MDDEILHTFVLLSTTSIHPSNEKDRTEYHPYINPCNEMDRHYSSSIRPYIHPFHYYYTLLSPALISICSWRWMGDDRLHPLCGYVIYPSVLFILSEVLFYECNGWICGRMDVRAVLKRGYKKRMDVRADGCRPSIHLHF